MYCKKCGGDVPLTDRFCSHCGAPARQIEPEARTCDVIDYEIVGDDMQAVIITLDPQEGVRSESGAMMYMQDGIQMSTGVDGGIWKGVKRMFTGESFFLTTFTNIGNVRADVSFAAPYPGKIVPLDLAKDREYICQKDAFLCAANGVDIEIAFTKKLGAGFFGGEGFILQKISGDGYAFIHAGGTIVELDLKPGETLRVDTGCLMAFKPTVTYDIQFVGGFKNLLFGGEGLFLATLTGPGKVYLQTIPFNRLARSIIAASGVNIRGGEKKGTNILSTLTDFAGS